MSDTMDLAGRTVTPRALSLAALAAHFAWALHLALGHPGLAWEPDRVANWLYFRTLWGAGPELAGRWYFPAPKILAVLLFGPFGDGALEAVVVAVVAGLLAAAATWLVARSFGVVAGLGVALLLALDPLWTVLVATASADLLLAAALALAAFAWTSERWRLAGVAVLLATLAKTPAAAAALPLLVWPRVPLRARAWAVAGSAAGVAATLLGYALLLGDARAPFGFLAAYTALRGGGVEPVASWLGRWLRDDVLGPLGWAAPLAVVGLAAVLVRHEARAVRCWLALSLAVAAAFVVLAVTTGTVLFPRFLWSLELGALAACAIGASVVGGALGALARAPEASRLRHAAAPIAALLLIGVAAGQLAARPDGSNEHYVVLFDRGARTALPWLAQASARLRAGDRLVVPLWFQPAALWTLRDADVVAAEVAVARGDTGAAGAEWLLLAPGYYENPATRQWSREAARDGWDVVASSELPRMSLLQRCNAGAPPCEPLARTQR